MKDLSLEQRAALILEEQGLDQAALGRAANVSRALVGQWVNGPAKKMGYEPARRLHKKYGYGIDWLIDGSGQKFTKDRTQGKSNVSPGPDIQRKAPLISWVQAGEFTEPTAVRHVAEDDVQGYYVPKKGGKNVYCLRVEGDSMTSPYGRSYPSGCIIFVDPDQRSPSNGSRVIAKLNGSADVTFKVLVVEAGGTFLKPLNPQHPPISQPFRILGTVIGKWEDE